MLELSAQHRKSSEELSARLNDCFGKSLSGLSVNRQIVRCCPRAEVVCVYTPTLFKPRFLPDLIPKCKSEEKTLNEKCNVIFVQ